MMPIEFEAAADVCFAAAAVQAERGGKRRPVLLEELARRLAVLREALEPRGDRIFHNGVHRAKRALQVLVLACDDWMQDGAHPSSDAARVVMMSIARVGELTQLAAGREAERKGGGTPCPARSTSKTGSPDPEAEGVEA